jgi:hypothetical protein
MIQLIFQGLSGHSHAQGYYVLYAALFQLFDTLQLGIFY